MPAPIPTTLSPFVQPAAPGSLTLITSTLDATSNWLLLRHIYAALRPEKQDAYRTRTSQAPADTEGEIQVDKNEDLNIILISFLRPFELWKEMAKKIGLDLPSLLSHPTPNPRLTYIDAFSHLCFPSNTPTPPLPPRAHPQIHTLSPFTTLAALESQILSHLPTASTAPKSNSSSSVLVLDQPDLLLATTTGITKPAPITPAALASTLLTLRARPGIHSTLLTVAADAPLLHPPSGAGEATPLEVSAREFVGLMAHQAQRVVQVRGLETGGARDVSGVVRVSRGGGCDWEGGEEGEEGEFLYEVKGDGGVRVWRRGE